MTRYDIYNFCQFIGGSMEMKESPIILLVHLYPYLKTCITEYGTVNIGYIQFKIWNHILISHLKSLKIMIHNKNEYEKDKDYHASNKWDSSSDESNKNRTIMLVLRVKILSIIEELIFRSYNRKGNLSQLKG